jgi:hypothetical protein
MIHELIWSSSGMILTEENRRIRRKTCPSATLSTTKPIQTDLGVNAVRRMPTNFMWWLEILKGGDHAENLDVDGRIIFKERKIHQH